MINKIHLGDSLEIIKQIPDESIDLIVTDPPYIINGDTNSNTKEWRGVKSLDKIKKGLNHIANGFKVEEYFIEFERLMKKFNAFIFCSNHQIVELMQEGQKRGYFTTLLVWHKTNTVPFANGVFRSDLEYIVHIRESGATFLGNAKEKSRIYISPTEVSKYGHPTEKPIELIKRYIRIGSNENDVVLDPFLGSGTTVQACINLNRQYIGIEIDEKYYQVACERRDKAIGNVGLFK